MTIVVTDSPNTVYDEVIEQKTREFSRNIMGKDLLPLSVYLTNGDGELIGGLKGSTYWGYLHVDFLWVSETARGMGAGSRILSMAEQEASSRGCTGVTLDTFSFQALPFYLKLGYTQIGILDNYKSDAVRYYLAKELTQ